MTSTYVFTFVCTYFCLYKSVCRHVCIDVPYLICGAINAVQNATQVSVCLHAWCSLPFWHHCSLSARGYQSLYTLISCIHLDYHSVDVMRRSAKFRFSRNENKWSASRPHDSAYWLHSLRLGQMLCLSFILHTTRICCDILHSAVGIQEINKLHQFIIRGNVTILEHQIAILEFYSQFNYKRGSNCLKLYFLYNVFV